MVVGKMTEGRISGIRHWWQQRLSALLLALLIGWLLFALSSVGEVTAVGSPLSDMARDWLLRPLNGLCVAFMLTVAFWHGYLGLGIIIDDYVHEPSWNKASHRLAWLWCFGFAVLSVGSIVFLYGNYGS